MTAPFQPVNGHRASVPILGQAIKTWVCGNGHEYQAPVAFRLPIVPLPGGQAIMSGSCCPFCLGAWIGAQFGVTEKGAAVELEGEGP